MTTRDVSAIQEKNVAKYLEGARTANSGATAFSKGDVIAGDCIVECKTKMSSAGSFTISHEWLTKLEQERISMGKMLAALAISFDAGRTSYFIIDQKTMRLFLELYEKERGQADG